MILIAKIAIGVALGISLYENWTAVKEYVARKYNEFRGV